LITKHFCICGTSNARVSISLSSSIAFEAILLAILFFAGVTGEGTLVASGISVCLQQATLLLVFLTSNKVRTRLKKFLKKAAPEKGTVVTF